MAHATTRPTAFCRLHKWQGVGAAATCLMLGACGQLPNPGAPEMLALKDPTPQAREGANPGEELAKATEYWGKQYSQNSRDLKTALNYARNLKAMDQKRRALAVLQQASLFHGENRELAGEYGRLALDMDQLNVANKLLTVADDPTNPDWRVISARGTLLAKQGKYRDAIPYYERALTLSDNHSSIMSNLALAHAMSGEPKRAEGMLRQAADANRASPKIRQNLALVLSLQGKYDEAKMFASQGLSNESASENTEYVRRIVKLEPKEAPKPESASQLAHNAPDMPASQLAHNAPDVPAIRPEGSASASDQSWAPQVALSSAPTASNP